MDAEHLSRDFNILAAPSFLTVADEDTLASLAAAINPQAGCWAKPRFIAMTARAILPAPAGRRQRAR